MPATALYPDSTVGNCWPFAGDKGTLGILLARRVQVTSVTVEHAAHEVTFDQRSAPKTIEVVSMGSVTIPESALLTCF
jgi:SUN domain-containing protein 1/2